MFKLRQRPSAFVVEKCSLMRARNTTCVSSSGRFVYNQQQQRHFALNRSWRQKQYLESEEGKRFKKEYKFEPPFNWKPVYVEWDGKSRTRKFVEQLLRNPWKVTTLILIIGAVMVIISLRDILSPNSTIADLMPQFMKSILRVVRSFVTVGLIVVDYKWTLWGVTDPEERSKLRKQAHKKSAERLLNLCLANGGVFIKAGQHIAALNQVLPAEYTTTLQPCQDRAPTRPWSEIEEFFRKEFGHGVDHYFSEFDPTPIAAASLAQVYKARLRDGSLVAVKVQYPNLEEQVKHDTKTFERLINVVEYFFPDVKLMWLVEEFERTVPHELNFIEEGKNSERLAGLLQKNFRDRVVCPKVFWGCTSSRILTLEFVEGVKVNDRIGLSLLQADAAQVAQLLTEVFCEQIFLHGFVHCDGHPGNLLIRRNNTNGNQIQLVILDHGLYQEIDTEMRTDYAKLWKGIVERNETDIKEYSKKMGINNYELFTIMLTARTFDMEDIGMQTEMTKEQGKRLKKYGQDNFFAITQVLSDVNRKTLLLLKCNDLLRAVQMDLGIPVNYFLTFAKYAMKGINRSRLESKDAGFFTYLSCMKDYATLSFKLGLFYYYQLVVSTWDRFVTAVRVGVSTFSGEEPVIIKKKKAVTSTISA